MYLFRITVEVKHMEGTQLPSDCAGGCVGVYLRAENIKAAIDLAEASLLEDKFLPVRTLEATEVNLEAMAEQYDMPGEDELAEGEPDFDDLLAIMKQGGVWYTAFHLFSFEKHEVQ
ncbi:MAG: hypothetical protein JJU10_11960 [Idiomarina sp.]|nr:hypothetical protein [Idiomarina sp.]